MTEAKVKAPSAVSRAPTLSEEPDRLYLILAKTTTNRNARQALTSTGMSELKAQGGKQCS